VVCDLQMPGGGGIAVAKACGADTRIVILTVSEQERDLLDAVAAGAVGYLTKSTPGDELRAALLRAAAGEPVFSPHARDAGARRVPADGAAGDRHRPADRPRAGGAPARRAGLPYREIGEQLHIAPKTVENHVRNILDKLHLNRKQELVRYAVEHGIE
jgi:DNA-binding NarL/FixJ family response regulator